MAKVRKAFVVALGGEKDPQTGEMKGQREVVLVKLRSGELLEAMARVPKRGTDAAQQYAIALEGLRQSIRKVDGADVSYQQLLGDHLDDFFEVDELALLTAAWRRVHLPDEAAVESVEGGLRAVSST